MRTQALALDAMRRRLPSRAEAHEARRGAGELSSFDPAGRIALDVGASTGGFTRGAARTRRGARSTPSMSATGSCTRACAAIRASSRSRAATRATLTRATVPEPVAAIVADVSFISLTKALAPALGLAAPGAWLVALIKPQFEVGPRAHRQGRYRARRRRRVRGPSRRHRVAGAQPGWRIAGVIPSPIKGGVGKRGIPARRALRWVTLRRSISRASARRATASPTRRRARCSCPMCCRASACRRMCGRRGAPYRGLAQAASASLPCAATSPIAAAARCSTCERGAYLAWKRERYRGVCARAASMRRSAPVVTRRARRTPARDVLGAAHGARRGARLLRGKGRTTSSTCRNVR